MVAVTLTCPTLLRSFRPVWPRGGSWMGFRPHPPEIENHLFRFNKLMLVAAAVSRAIHTAWAAAGRSPHGEGHWDFWQPLAYLHACHFVAWLCMVLSFASSQDALKGRHFLYIMLGLSPLLSSLADGVDDPTDLSLISTIAVRWLLHVVEHATIQFVMLRQLSLPTLLLVLPGILVYLLRLVAAGCVSSGNPACSHTQFDADYMDADMHFALFIIAGMWIEGPVCWYHVKCYCAKDMLAAQAASQAVASSATSDLERLEHLHRQHARFMPAEWKSFLNDYQLRRASLKSDLHALLELWDRSGVQLPQPALERVAEFMGCWCRDEHSEKSTDSEFDLAPLSSSSSTGAGSGGSVSAALGRIRGVLRKPPCDNYE